MRPKPRPRRETPGQLERRYLRKAGYVLLALLAGGWLFARPDSAAIESVYSRGLYPVIANVLVPLTNALPVSLAVLLLVALPIAAITVFAISFRRHPFKIWLPRTLGRLFAGGLVLYALFVLIWGANYERLPVETQFDLREVATTEADLMRLVAGLQGVLERDYQAPANVDAALAATASELIRLVNTVTGTFPTLPSDVKRLPPGSLILSGGASGIISPWTLEPHVDGALHPTDVVAVGAHELAHVAGYAGEADADLIAALAGLGADDAFARYAAALRLWTAANWQLPRNSAQANFGRLPAAVKADYEARLEPYRRFQVPTAVRDVQRGLYDRYLKSQGVTSGVQDYSRTVDLLIQAQRQGWVLAD